MSESHWFRVLAGPAALTALVVVVTLPIAVAIEPTLRPAVIRVAAALVVGFTLMRVTGQVRARFEAEPRSAFEAALHPVRAPVSIDQRFTDLRDEIRLAALSERFFHRALWPRLLALADRLPYRPALVSPARSRIRRLLRLGPPVAALRELIAELERRA
jgi:hypothetical protein